MQKNSFTISSKNSSDFEEGEMGIETVITAGDRRPFPYFVVPPQEKASTQGAASGTFEDALRLAIARAK